MAVEQKKVVDEALDGIQSAIIDKGGLLGDLPDQLDNLRKAQEELTKAQDEYNMSLESGTHAEQEVAKKSLIQHPRMSRMRKRMWTSHQRRL